MAHTNAEWLELMSALRKIVENPAESRERRRKAQRILDSVVRGGTKSQIAAQNAKEKRRQPRRYNLEDDLDGEIR